MAAVSGSREDLQPHIEGLEGLVVANENAPDQHVLSGPTPAVEQALERLAAAGIAASPIPVACAFHSPAVAPAAATFAEDVRAAGLRAPVLPVYANTTAEPYPADDAATRALLAGQIAERVRFGAEIERMHADGIRLFVEVGPGRVLTGLVSRILAGKPHRAVACGGRSGSLADVLAAVAELAVSGVPVDAEPLFLGRRARLVDLAGPSPDAVPPTAWWVNGQTARPVTGELPPHAFRPVEGPVVQGPALAAGAATADESREAVVLEYLRGVREMVETQRRVMLGYLGAPVDEPAVGPPEREPGAEKPLEEPVEEAAPPAASASLPANVGDLLLEIVAERTGYPIEMLGLDIDLESDLSIDSIKRIEILGTLGERLGLPAGPGGGDEKLAEELASLRTIREIVGWFEQHAEDGKSEPERPASVPRYVPRLTPAPALEATAESLAGRRFAIVPDEDGVAEQLLHSLQALGADTRLIAPGDTVGDEELVDLTGLVDAAIPALPTVFMRVRDALVAGSGSVCAATGLGGSLGVRPNGYALPPGAGIAGLVKSAAKEWPDRRIHVVDLAPERGAAELAERLVTELLADDGLREVGYEEASRLVLAPIRAEVTADGELDLDPGAVCLLTGGARGIAAAAALALGTRFGCRLVLVGRSQEPAADEEPELAAAEDAPALRRVLAARGLAPREIEPECRRILAEREIRATLAKLAAAGVEAEYHTVDVRDDAAFGALIDEVYERYGRLDGVVHAPESSRTGCCATRPTTPSPGSSRQRSPAR